MHPHARKVKLNCHKCHAAILSL